MSQRTIEILYSAFKRLDAKTMANCYAEGARFDDEAFSLQGRDQIAGMWRMLCEGVRDKGRDVWRLDVRDITENSAHWEPHYRFSATGRIVHNIIDAQFEFDRFALITRHVDRFDFWRWSRQALGAPGWLLGWTPFLRNKVRAQAAATLAAYLARSAKQ